MSFNFGTPKTTGQASVFSMSTPVNTSTTAFGSIPLPTFGSSSSLPSSTPILGSTAATTKPAFNLGSMNTPPFSLGTTPNFGFPSATNVQPNNTVAAATTSAPTSFTPSTMPASQAPTTLASTGFSLAGTTQASTGFSLGGTTQPSTGFSIGNTTQASTGFSLGSSTTPVSTGFTLSTTPAVSSSFSLSTTPASTTGFSLGTTGTTAQTVTTQITTAVSTQAPLTTSQPDSQSSLAQPTNFQQLVDLINNWTVSLENQEKQFLNQANEITVWDNILTNQSAKLVKLYDMLERKEKEQLDIEQELDFLLSQQKELEDCLVPLEQELQSAEVLSSLNNEREPIYKAAQEIDNQVKQMSSDIKEIVNNLNKTNSKKDSDDDLDTICRILNCHMTALQYIEHNAENLSTMVKEVNEEHTRFLSAANDSSFMLNK
ncbi:Hypothetical protein CINCED_3A011950 [Cinara cedri]|uniref:Nucleoporin NSP1-like C-terminal domain-containing protein n=1 Tax=Cinara cedri TaxID=506608 RepID=A0A5E4MKI1_9HEMI|nr:Hypothetical protein CINCED_3A011950 [Cinara cedri]